MSNKVLCWLEKALVLDTKLHFLHLIWKACKESIRFLGGTSDFGWSLAQVICSNLALSKHWVIGCGVTITTDAEPHSCRVFAIREAREEAHYHWNLKHLHMWKNGEIIVQIHLLHYQTMFPVLVMEAQRLKPL
jgi:hypothetical protein